MSGLFSKRMRMMTTTTKVKTKIVIDQLPRPPLLPRGIFETQSNGKGLISGLALILLFSTTYPSIQEYLHHKDALLYTLESIERRLMFEALFASGVVENTVKEKNNTMMMMLIPEESVFDSRWQFLFFNSDKLFRLLHHDLEASIIFRYNGKEYFVSGRSAGEAGGYIIPATVYVRDIRQTDSRGRKNEVAEKEKSDWKPLYKNKQVIERNIGVSLFDYVDSVSLAKPDGRPRKVKI